MTIKVLATISMMLGSLALFGCAADASDPSDEAAAPQLSEERYSVPVATKPCGGSEIYSGCYTSCMSGCKPHSCIGSTDPLCGSCDFECSMGCCQ